MKKNVIKTLSLIVLPEGEPLFSERATIVSVADEAAGCYLVLEQCTDEKTQKIALDFDEWPLINKAAKQLQKVWAR